MTDLKRLEEAFRRIDTTTDIVRFAYDDGFEPIVEAARAYRDLLANGERVEPDYEEAYHEYALRTASEPQALHPDTVKAIVDAAVGGRLLVDPPKEEET